MSPDVEIHLQVFLIACSQSERFEPGTALQPLDALPVATPCWLRRTLTWLLYSLTKLRRTLTRLCRTLTKLRRTPTCLCRTLTKLRRTLTFLCRISH
jgi:hypothetical protein